MQSFFKKPIVLVVLFFVFSFFLSLPANAQYMLQEFANTAGYPTDSNVSLISSVNNIINVALSLVGLIFLGMALYAGMRWLTAQGNEENVTKAKDALEAAVTGMVVVALSYAITNLVFSLTGSGAVTSQDPVEEIDDSEPSMILGTAGQSCQNNNDCDSGVCGSDLKCVDKKDTCAKDSDCIGEEKCMGGLCQNAGSTASDKCSGGCPAGEYCNFEGECKAGCAKDSDCTDGEVCMPGLNKCEAPTNVGSSCGPGGKGKCAFSGNPPAGYGGWIDDYLPGQKLCGDNVGVKCFFLSGSCVVNSQCEGICDSATNVCNNSQKGKCLKDSSKTWVESGLNICMSTTAYQNCVNLKTKCLQEVPLKFQSCLVVCDGLYNYKTQEKDLKKCNDNCNKTILNGKGIPDEFCNQNYLSCVKS